MVRKDRETAFPISGLIEQQEIEGRNGFNTFLGLNLIEADAFSVEGELLLSVHGEGRLFLGEVHQQLGIMVTSFRPGCGNAPFIADLVNRGNPDIELRDLADILLNPGTESAVSKILFSLFADLVLPGFVRQETLHGETLAVDVISFFGYDKGNTVDILIIQLNLEGEAAGSVRPG